ncbi:MAG: branched-chain amino acid ABC transporter permease, partial [Pseudomonadota bacterium]|nr:branched-chain amino acid ABC transporter permease [Pseudomonadota bacterium]
MAKHGGHVFWYTLLLVTAIAAPLLVDTYWLNEVSRFLIFALAGLGLMIVTGYTGQVSLGHAAFLAVGAYAHTYLISHEMPFVISLLLAAF